MKLQSKHNCAARPNPSLKRSANGRPPGPVWRYAVRGTFSPARAWRPAVVARLARTLGHTLAAAPLQGHEQPATRNSALKMILTPAKSPDEYFAYLTGGQAAYARALRRAVQEADSELEERLKWGHAVYFSNGPVLLIRAEPSRVLFTFWRGKRMRHIEPRLKAGGKYEMATLELKEGTPLSRETVVKLVAEAAALNRTVGNPTTLASSVAESAA